MNELELNKINRSVSIETNGVSIYIKESVHFE